MNPDQCGISARASDGVGHHLTVILLIDPAAAGKVNMTKHCFQHIGNGGIIGDIAAGKLFASWCITMRAVIFRRIIDQWTNRNVTGGTAIFQQD